MHDSYYLHVISLGPEVQSEFLGKIADLMATWEGLIADKLGLTDVDVEAIKTKYPRDLRLQT